MIPRSGFPIGSHGGSATCQSPTRTMWTHWSRPWQIGAEHRPHQPCAGCTRTLYWTVAGADMCAVCLPMPRLSEQSLERIAKLFPRPRPGHDAVADARNKPTQFGDTVRRGRASRSV